MYQPKFGHVLPEGAVEFGNWLSVNYWEAVKEFATSPWTLLHLDYRVDNLMFDTDLNSPDAVAVIDWQSVGRGPAGYDLAYLLGGSVTVEDRRKYEDQWLHEYHDEITRLGVNYAFEDLYKDYVRAHVIGGTSTAVLTGATFDLGNERGVALIASMGERHFAAPLDHNGRQFFSV
jgi:aminoglycoside phosphotransferase (APT) family kinase protein